MKAARGTQWWSPIKGGTGTEQVLPPAPERENLKALFEGTQKAGHGRFLRVTGRYFEGESSVAIWLLRFLAIMR